MDIQSDENKHIDRKLVRRIRILVLIMVVMSGAMFYEVYLSDIDMEWVILAVILGLAMGFVAGRIFSIEWHREKSQVIGRLDVIGVVVLVSYITFSIARSWIFSHWFKGAKLSAFTFSFIEAAMLGRVISMRFNINRVLEEQGKI